jgi:uncharacterized membrane protein YqiK
MKWMSYTEDMMMMMMIIIVVVVVIIIITTICQSACLAPKAPNQILCLQSVPEVLYQDSKITAIIFVFIQLFCLWQ